MQLLDAGKRILEIPIPTYYGDEICYVNGMRYARDVVKDVLEYRLVTMGFGTSEWVPKPPEYAFKDGDGSSHAVILEMLAACPRAGSSTSAVRAAFSRLTPGQRVTR